MNSKGKMMLSVLWVVLGVALVGLSVAKVLDSSLWAGIGGALVAVGALQLVRNHKYRTDSAYKEKVDVELGDERNEFIRMKSWRWAGFVVVIVEGIGMVVALALGQETVHLVLSYCVCLILVAYWIAWLVMSRVY